jgi:hypothetical protein
MYEGGFGIYGGEPRERMDRWERDLQLTPGFNVSIVPSSSSIFTTPITQML